jgi:hypothetical protein
VVDLESGDVGKIISANVVPTDIIVVVDKTLPDVMVRVANGVATPTTTYVVGMTPRSPKLILDIAVLV